MIYGRRFSSEAAILMVALTIVLGHDNHGYRLMEVLFMVACGEQEQGALERPNIQVMLWRHGAGNDLAIEPGKRNVGLEKQPREQSQENTARRKASHHSFSDCCKEVSLNSESATKEPQ